MRLNIISVAQKMPHWIQEGFAEYQKRFPRDFSCALVEIPLSKKRSKNDTQDKIHRLVLEEGEHLKAMIPRFSKTIALEEEGQTWSSTALAKQLSFYAKQCSTLNFLIGGPDGLSEECLKVSDQKWSLSKLTLPHGLVRIIVIEQLYRAVCILKNHPYHRA